MKLLKTLARATCCAWLSPRDEVEWMEKYIPTARHEESTSGFNLRRVSIHCRRALPAYCLDLPES